MYDLKDGVVKFIPLGNIIFPGHTIQLYGIDHIII